MNEQEDINDIQISRIVHFVIYTDGRQKCRPALVVEDWPDQGKPGYCNLTVFPDGSNDGRYGIDDHTHQFEVPVSDGNLKQATYQANVVPLMRWETSVLPNHAVKVVRTWHWPRECKKLKEPALAYLDSTNVMHHHNHAEGVTDVFNCWACMYTSRNT